MSHTTIRRETHEFLGKRLTPPWKVVRKMKGTVWFPIAFVIIWYAFLLLFPYTYEGLPPCQDFILNSLLWISLGILFRLPKLAGDVEGNSPAAGSVTAVRTV